MVIPLIMITLFIGIVVFVLGKVSKNKLVQVLSILGAAIAISLIMVLNGIVRIDNGYARLVKEWGKPIDVKFAGIHLINPISQEVVEYSTRTEQLEMVFQAYSLDAQTVDVNLVVQYEVDPTKIIMISEQYGDMEALKLKIQKIFEDKTKGVFSSKSAMTIVETRESLGVDLLSSIKTLENTYGIFIKEAVASDISFSDGFENAVEQKMLAEQAKLQAEYDKEKAIIKASELYEVNKKEAESIVVKANAEAEALEIMQTAWSALSEQVRQVMLQQQFIDKWNGILPQVMTNNGTGMMFDISNLNKTIPISNELITE